jgi:hypothetical protein
MQDGMLDAADVLIHRHPVIDIFFAEGFVIVAR